MLRGIRGKRVWDETVLFFAFPCRFDWIYGSTCQTAATSAGCVEKDRAPVLEVASSKRKPRLVWDRGEGAGWEIHQDASDTVSAIRKYFVQLPPTRHVALVPSLGYSINI